MYENILTVFTAFYTLYLFCYIVINICKVELEGYELTKKKFLIGLIPFYSIVTYLITFYKNLD